MLEHDANPSRPPATRAGVQGSARRGLGIFAQIVGGAAGVFIGGWIGSAVAPKPDPTAVLDFSGLDYVMYGGFIGFIVGAVALPLGVPLLVKSIATSRSRGASVHERTGEAALEGDAAWVATETAEQAGAALSASRARINRDA